MPFELIGLVPSFFDVNTFANVASAAAAVGTFIATAAGVFIGGRRRKAKPKPDCNAS